MRVTRRLLVAAVVAAALGDPASAVAAAPPRCVVVDVGASAAPGPVRAAVETALGAAKRVRPHPDAEVRAALRGEAPASQQLQPGRAALAAAATAYGALKCDETLTQAARAFDLLEGEATDAAARDDLRRALVYLLLCKDTRGDAAGAAEAAALLRVLAEVAAASGKAPTADGGVAAPSGEAPPAGVSREVWQRYPAPRPAAATHSIEVRTEPPGAEVLVDLRPVGVTPATLTVAPGRHRLVVARPGHVPWRRQVEVSKGGVVYDVTLAPRPADRHASLRAALAALAKRPKAERQAAAAGVGREAGADRVLAIEIQKGRLRARFVDAPTGDLLGAPFEADARTLTARPADLTVFLDGADAAVPAKAPASRPATHSKIGSKWWHWVIGAAVVAALGVAIWQSEKSSDQVTIRVTKP
jgi:hypothetical protein